MNTMVLLRGCRPVGSKSSHDIPNFQRFLGVLGMDVLMEHLLFQSTFSAFFSPALYVRSRLAATLFQMFFLAFWITNPYPSNATNAPTKSSMDTPFMKILNSPLKQLQSIGQRHLHFVLTSRTDNEEDTFSKAHHFWDPFIRFHRGVVTFLKKPKKHLEPSKNRLTSTSCLV